MAPTIACVPRRTSAAVVPRRAAVGAVAAVTVDGQGGDLAPISVVAGEAISRGAAVAVFPTDGKLYRARADVFTKAHVIGFATAAADTGFACSIDSRSMTLPDWTAIAGAASLSSGATYYLSATPGQITASPPAIGGQTLVELGLAASAQTLAIAIQQPVIL